MNCLEFRRTHDTEPASRDESFLRHRRECAACRAHSARAACFEQQLAASMQVPVPENLASKILLRQSFLAGDRRTRWPRYGLALAASLVLLAVLLYRPYEIEPVPGLDRDVVEVIEVAQHALAASKPVAWAQVQLALRPAGVGLSGDIGVVTFASPCVVRGKIAGHIVIRGDKAPVTVLLMPSERVRVRSSFGGPDYRGYLVPTDVGTIAIVGAPEEGLERFEDQVRAAVRWKA